MLKKQGDNSCDGEKEEEQVFSKDDVHINYILTGNQTPSSPCDRNDSTNINDDNISYFNGIHSVTIRYCWLSGHDL